MSERSNLKVAILSSVATALICISTAAALYFWNENRQLKTLLANTGSPSPINKDTAISKDTAESMKRTCLNYLRMIDTSVQQWALEQRKTPKDLVTPSDLREFLIGYAPNGWPQCPAGGRYQLTTVDTSPTCSLHGNLLAQ